MDTRKKDSQWTQERFWFLRESLGLSRYEMAMLVGVTERTIFRWEKGQAHPQPFIIRRVEEIERGLLSGSNNVPKRDLVELEKNPKRPEDLQTRFDATVKTLEEIVERLKQVSSHSHKN